jgi:hypothetical protein
MPQSAPPPRAADFSICGFHEAYESRPANFHQAKAAAFSPAYSFNGNRGRARAIRQIEEC